MEDKRKALYDALVGEYDLGTYEDFTAKLNDESKRKALYDAAGQDYNLGTYEEYSEKLGFGPSGSNVVPIFDDEPQAAPAQENVEENSRKLRGLWANFKESSKGLWAGIKGYAGEQLNMFTGSSREEQAALSDIERLEEQGVDVIQYLADKEDAEFQQSYGMSKDEFMALDKKERKKLVRQASKIMLDQQTMMSDAELKEQRRQQTNQQAVEDAFYKALEMAGGDLTKAKAILREQAADKTKGDILIEEATETMNNLRQPEGFAGWVGNLLPQMVPAATSIAINYLTKGKASGLSKALGYGTMGGLTLSTAGMSMLEARNAGATNLEVWTTGIADGAIEIISEKIPFDRVTKRVFSSAKANVAEKLSDAVLTPKGRKELEKLLSDANEKLGGKLFSKKNVGEWLTDTAYEAAGEFTAEALQTITTMIYENPEDYPTISEVLANGWEGAKAGLFMGSVTGGASLAASHAMNKERRQTQGYVDVAQMENENGDVEVVEVVGENPEDGTITILHGDTVENVSRDKIGDRFRFSYEEFENGRLRSREDDAIDNGFVNDGQIRGMEETIQRDLEELQNFFTAEEINQIASGTIPANASAEGVAAARRYMGDVQRIDDLHAAKAEQDQKRKDACRDRIESEVGQRFWVQEEGDDDGSGVVPVTETVEEVVYADGRVGYVVGSDEDGNLTMVYNDGSRGFSTRAEIAEKESSGEILSNTVMGLDDYLAVKVDIEDVTAEAARMEEEQAANVQSVQAAHPVGSTINVGTAEAKVEVPIIAVNADGAIVQMPDGTTPQLTWADIAHAEGQEVKPKTNAELDQEVVDEYKVAYQPAVKTGQEPSFTEREVEVEQTTPANPLPLKADGLVDQTALWNNDPERWAQWNDEQRQDGGANSLAYVSGAIAKEQAKIAELQAAYAAESDFDARDAIEKEIADTQARVERLTAIQQGYVAQAEAAAASVVEAEPVAPRVASQMSEQEKAAMDAQHQARLDAARSTTAKREAMQNYINEISQGSVPMTLISMDEYEQVMKDAGCTPNQIAQVKFALEEAKQNGESIPAFFVPRVGIFAFVENIPNVEQLRLTYVHERQHQFTAANKKYLNALLQLGLSRERLAEIVAVLSDSHFYDQFDDTTLADEVISYAMERAYTYEDFSVALQELGVEQEIIDIITEIDNEQRFDNSTYPSRRRGRYDLHDNSSEQGNRAEDDRNSEAVSGGLLGSQGDRSLSSSRGRTESGEGAEVISEEQLNAPNSGTAQQITAADGEVLADTDGKGGVRFSIRTWNEGGRDYLAAWLANDTTLTEEEKADIIARMDEFYKNALLYSDTYAPFGTWSDAGVRYDNNGNPLMSVIKANGDYAMNLDFSLVCKKRRPLNRLLRTLVNRNAFATYTLRERELAEINWILQEHGFEVACALCFVDSKRYRVTGVADVFAALYNRLVKSLAPEGVQIAHFNYNENPNVEVVENGLDTMPDDQLNWDRFDRMLSAYKPGSVEHKVAQYLREHPEARKLVDATDFIEAEGFESVKENNPDLLKFYNMKKGTGGPKASFGDVQYLNDILKKEKSFDAEKAYAVGGVRLQSFSDFVPHMYFDYMQLFAELAAKKLPLHAYTKEVLFTKIFGLTGAKINMSLVPAVVEGGIAPGFDAEGNYAWADPVTDAEGNVIQQGQSFPYDEAMAIQQAEGYSKNCGVIAVGISDAHIEKMLDDPNIPFIIPYHKSSLNAIVARMTNIDQYKDYTNVQNTRKASGSKLDKGTKDFNFNEYLHGLGESGTPQQAAQAYLDWCRENSYKPKFSQFAYHPNYYKLLQDFNTIDLATGEYAPQGAVTMTFPTEQSAFGNVETLIQQGLREDAELEEKMEQEIDAIADQVLARLDEISKEPKMSEKQQAKKMAELADERTAKIKAKAKGPIDLIEEAKKAVEEPLMFRFIGEQAAINFDRTQQSYELMNNLEVAREMLQQDVDARKIKAATGWEMGADGRWRLERPDFEFKAKPGKKKTFKLSELIEDASLFAEYPQLKNIKVRYKKLPNRLAGEVAQENGEDIIFINEENYRAYNPTYEQAIDEFTKMHPEIAKLIYRGNAGRLNAEQRKIFMDMMGPVLALESPYIEEMGGRNTLAHEIQHLIQKYEGFAEGGSEDMTDTTDPNDAKRVQELRRMLSLEIDIVNDMVGELNDMLRRGRAFEAAGNRESSIALRTVFDKKKREYQVHMDNVNYLKKELRKFKTLGAEGYKKLAGEVEARNVEKRLNMTEADRRQSLYSDTQDVATADQIFLRNNLMTTYASETLVPAIRFRVTAEQDKAYMDAVEAGDMKTAQRMVNEAAKLAMPNTKVMDKKGNPTVVYHGTKGKFNTFAYSREDIGFHFGTKGTARTRIGRGKDAHIMQVFLNIENPLIFDTDLGSWDADYIVKDLLKKEMMSYDDAKAILLTPNGYKRNSVSALVDLRQWMSNNGYDGIVYPNWYESDGKDSYIAFSRSQIKSADPVAYDDNGNVIPLSERFNPENADIRFRFTPRTDEQREQLFDKAREQYGVTNNFNASGYMLPDGSLLDFSEANDGGDPNRRSLDHRDIEGLIMDEGKEYDSRYKYVVDFVAEGAIRMLPEAAGFQLSVPPTAEQRSRLMDYIYKYDGEVIMEITDENGGPRVYMEYNKRTSPSRIFRDMDGFFNEGIVPGIPPLRFRIANNNQAIFVSNAARAVEGIKQEKATPEQWLKMIEKNGGLKAGEDKWMGLSDFLKASDKKTLTKQEVLDFVNENMIIIEETHYTADAEDDAASRHDLLEQRVNERYKEILNGLQDIEDYDERRFKAFNLLQEELGEFADNVDLERYGVYLTFPYEDLADYIEFADMFGVDIKLDNPIHDTRLAYTTPGLVNHHEIALTVPTIEPWNKHDDLHFGDAGNGRAVAWVRFGETWEQRPSPQISRKVLVIDEIQSKRHQDAREKNPGTNQPRGYRDDTKIAELRAKENALMDEKVELTKEILHKFGVIHYLETGGPGKFDPELQEKAEMGKIGSQEQMARMKELDAEISATIDERYALTTGIPDAPFDKNWHELAMKRMLRYAAENGYDVVAWTTGDQQADRYDLSRDVKKISASRQSKDGERIVNIYYRDEYNDYKNLVVDREGKVIYGDFFGSTLADVIGKEMALQIMSSEESTEFKGEGLKIGGEGMRGFYDKMLPAFMNKYGKKWGVKVEDIDLPNLGKSGRTMHSVPVTEDMKASVMEGQVMFRTTAITQEVQDEMDVISATAIVRGNYLKAPNGADTNLTPEQWALVRTKNFKQWFGDWEQLSELKEIEARKVEWLSAENIAWAKGKTLQEIEAKFGNEPKAVAYLPVEYLSVFGEEAANLADNRVYSGKGYYIDHAANHHHAVSPEKYINIQEVINNYDHLKRMQIDGHESIVFIKKIDRWNAVSVQLEVGENGRIVWHKSFYDQKKEPYKSLPDVQLPKIVSPEGGVSSISPTENSVAAISLQSRDDNAKLVNFLNPANISKVIDENGEPMVVYHGTPNEFWSFDKDKIGSTNDSGFWGEGFYFTSQEALAVHYAEGDRVLPVFLNIRNPHDFAFFTKEYYDHLERFGMFGDKDFSSSRITEELTKEGKDGVIRRDSYGGHAEYVVFSPNQIKSATDNTGEFSAEDKDIRFRTKSDVNTNPTEAQKKAGNYKMGHLNLDGYRITIEIPKGSVRRGTDSKGNAWENTLNNDYGYIRGTEGVDGDHIDVYLSDNPTEGNVFVIDQVNPETREFDEHKVMYGFNSAEEAREAYLANFSEGWNGLGTITEVSKDEFKKWIESSHRKTKPFSEYKSVRANEMQSTDESELRYRVVSDQETLDRLNSEPTIKVYRAMQLIDGKLYPPMSAKVDGELRQPIELGQWEEAEERPDLVDEKGRFKLDKGNKTSVPARYNPYFHTSRTPLNDQFSSAQTRPNLVTVEVEVPESELTSGYKADKAKDSVGEKEWKAGVVQAKLTGTRKVILSRWDKPVRIVPDSEVADVIVKMFDGKDIVMPSNVVTPSLRAELEKRGVPFVETDNQGNPVEEASFRVTGTPTDEVVTNGLQLTPAQTAEVAANIFAALPEESRKKITEGLNGDVLGLKDAILQIPTSLASKENWNDEDKQVADVVAEEMTKIAGEMTRPFSAEEGLWLLYNNLNKGTDLISQASRALVQRNLGFDAETLAKQEQAKEDVRFRTVGDASSNAEASLYNRGAVNVWTRLKESFVDMQASVEELVKAIEKRTGKVAQGFENILLALNQQSSKGLAAMESYTQKFLNPMFDEIRRIMNETKMKYEDVVRYVILKHGLERNKKLAQRDARAHYQEIYDDIISKITGMTAAQKRTYLTNAQLKEGDAKAELATLQAVDMSAMTNEEKKEHKKKLAAARKAVEEAEEYLKRAQKIASMSEQEAQDELDKIFEKIENGTDSVFKEMRENDYSGISSMFYDQLGVDRKNFSTEEQYQAALMEAKKDRYSSLKDVEAAAEAEVKSFEGKTDTKELWKRINAATKETLRQQYEANMISKDQYLNLRDMFEYYVPLRGFKDNTAEDMYTYYRKPNSTGYTKPILGAEGRKTEAESPFGWIAAMAGSAIASNVKNEAKLALYYFVSNRPENGIATISKTWFVDSGEVDERGKKIFKPAYPPFSEDLSSAEGKAQYEIWQANMKELQKKGQAYEAGQRLNLGNAVVNISDANKPEHIVNVKVGGKDYTIIINGNPRAAQAINGDLNIEQTGSADFTRFLGPWLRWMSSVNTSYNPEFWITNMMRDMAFTWMAVNIKEDPVYRRKFSKNYRKAFRVISLVAKNEKGTIGDSYLEQQYKDFVKYGGVTGYTQIKDSETWEKEIENYLSSNDPESVKNGKVMRGMKTAFHAAHRFGESLEQVSRFAAFLTAREMRKSISEAIDDAKEITVNFNRKGSGKWISFEEAKYLTGKNGQPLSKPRQWMAVGLSSIAPLGRRFIMFFNASIQGLNATYKLWKKNPKRFVGWMAGYMALGAMNAILHAMMDDDDDYLDIPQYERRNSLMIGGNGAYFKWALPQEPRVLYALGDLMVETALGRNPHQSAIKEAGKLLLEIAPVNPAEGAMALIPSQFKPGIELWINKDYKGEPIYNEMKWLSDEERRRTARWSKAYQGTADVYVGIAQGLNYISGGDKYSAGSINIAPEMIQHIVQSAFGGTLRTADKFYNLVSAAIDPEKEVTMRQTPFLNKIFTINDERFKNVHVNDVFDYYKADAEHALTLEKQYIKDRDMDSLTELRSSDEYQWAKIYGKYKKPLKTIQDKIKVADGTAEKKELMKQQDELKKRMIKEISEL